MMRTAWERNFPFARFFGSPTEISCQKMVHLARVALPEMGQDLAPFQSMEFLTNPICKNWSRRNNLEESPLVYSVRYLFWLNTAFLEKVSQRHSHKLVFLGFSSSIFCCAKCLWCKVGWIFQTVLIVANFLSINPQWRLVYSSYLSFIKWAVGFQFSVVSDQSFGIILAFYEKILLRKSILIQNNWS